MQIISNQLERLDAPRARSCRDIITANLIIVLRDVAQQNGCFVFGSDVKVWASGEVVTPSVSVVCGPVNYHEGDQTIYTDPVLMADVVSTDVANDDWEQRLQTMRSVKSLTNYLRVSDNEVHVVAVGGRWKSYWFRSEHTDSSEVLGIPAIAGAIAVADIYRKF